MTQAQVVSSRSKYTIDEILNKEQFKIKLNIRYFIFSGPNLVAFIAAYLFTSSFIFFICVYAFLMLGFYKFFFSLTKDGKQYNPLLIKKYANLMRVIRIKNVRKKVN